MPYNPPTEPKVTSYPPKPRPAQLSRSDLRNMTPEAINQAREAGALDDLMSGRKPVPAEGS